MRRIAAFLLLVIIILGTCACDSKTTDTRLAEGSIEITADNLPKIAVTELNVNLAVNLVSLTLGCDKEAALEYITVLKTPDECYRLLADGGCDIIFAHEPSETAVSYITEKGLNFERACVAKDALVFTVSEQNTVTDLSIEQIASVYSSQTANWSSFGAHDGEIKTFKAPKNSSAAYAFLKYTNIHVEDINVPKRQIVTESGSYLAELPYDNGINAITFALYSDLQRPSTERFGTRKYLSVAGVKPDASAIQSGAYPLCYDVFLTFNADIAEDSVTRLYKNWIMSDQGVKIIGGSGVILPIKS